MMKKKDEDELENYLFTDIFRRADKNDDGKISKEEFFSFFSDDHLSDEELSTMFHSIDTNLNQVVEVEELIDYFRKDFVPYAPLFSAVENGHAAVSDVLLKLHQNYSSLDWIGQYKVRFYLQEYLNQVQNIYRPISTALDRIQENTPSHRPITKDRDQVKHVKHTEVLPQFEESLQNEISRLSSLLSKLEKSKIYLNLQDQIEIDDSEEKNHVIVSRRHSVDTDSVDGYMEATRFYLTETKLESGCVSTYIIKKGEEEVYTLYQIWSSLDALHNHHKQPHYKTFAKNLVDFLIIPEEFNKISVPQAWIK